MLFPKHAEYCRHKCHYVPYRAIALLTRTSELDASGFSEHSEADLASSVLSVINAPSFIYHV